MHDLWEKLVKYFKSMVTLIPILNKAAELPVKFELKPCIIMNIHTHTSPNITGTLHERHAISIIVKTNVRSTIWLG